MRLSHSLIILGIATLLTIGSIGLANIEARARIVAVSDKHFCPFSWGDIATVQFFGKEGLAVAEFRHRESKEWVVRTGSDKRFDTADSQVISDLSALVIMAADNKLPITPAEAGLAGDGVPQIAFETTTKMKESILVGKLSPDGKQRYVTLLSSPDEVHGINPVLLKILDRKPVTFQSKDLFDFSGHEPTGITLSSGKNTTRLIRDADGWFVHEPVKWEAADNHVERLLRLCQGLKAESVVVGTPENLREYGFAGDSPSAALAFDSGKEQRVVFGRLDREKNLVFARNTERETLFAVSAMLYDEVMLGHEPAKRAEWANRYRKKGIDLLQGRLPAKISIRVGKEELLIIRKDDLWEASGCRNFSVNVEFVRRLLGLMSTVKIADFVEEERSHLDTYGLAPPEWNIVCKDQADGIIGSISLNNPLNYKECFAIVGGRSQVLKLHPYSLNLYMPFILYRSQRLATLDPNRIWEISVIDRGTKRTYRRTTGNNRWQLVHPETYSLGAGEVHFVGLVYGLSALSCGGFVAEGKANLKQFGLDRPWLRVIVSVYEKGKTGGKIAYELLVGSYVEDKEHKPSDMPPAFAKLAGDPAVFVIKGEYVRELIKVYR